MKTSFVLRLCSIGDLFAMLCSSCTSTGLHRTAAKAGIADLRSPSLIQGRFQNRSEEPFVDGNLKLWELLNGIHDGVYGLPKADHGESHPNDHVEIAEMRPDRFTLRLLSDDKVRREVRLTYSVDGNCLKVWHRAQFGWLPLGYTSGSYDLAISRDAKGDLVAFYHFSAGGVVMLIGSAGESGTVIYHFHPADRSLQKH